MTPPHLIPGTAYPLGAPATWRDGPQAHSCYVGMSHKRQKAASAGCGHHEVVCNVASQDIPKALHMLRTRTFFGLGIGDLQITVGCLQLLLAHDLALEVAKGDVEPAEVDHIIVQLGEELVVDARHGRSQAVPAPLPCLAQQMTDRGLAASTKVRAHGKADRGGWGEQHGLELVLASGVQRLQHSATARP